MRCGDSFLMTGAGGIGKAHLWIAVTEPQADTSHVVIVSLTTLRYDRDQTVILQPGDHPFITHQTIVLYSDTRIVDARRLDAIIRDGTALAHQPCPPQTLKLIQQGVSSSPYTPRKIIAFCREAWGLRPSES
jgi:hypothetical protein